MLTKESAVDQITVGNDGTVFVRTATVIKDDGVEVSKTYHRQTFEPWSDISGQEQRVRDIAAVAWADIPQPTPPEPEPPVEPVPEPPPDPVPPPSAT